MHLAETRKYNTFKDLGDELWVRLAEPLLNFTYWTHLLVGVCFYGAIGVWAEVVRHFVLGAEEGSSNILLAMHATYPAIIGATAMQLLLNKDQPTYMRAFAQLISTIFFCVAATSILASGRLIHYVSFLLAMTGNLCAILFWWIANARDDGLNDRGDGASDAVGGAISINDATVIAGGGSPVFAGSGDQPIETSLGRVRL
nr:hypothetical protein [Brevundimonas diminuta]